jgi:hypothetical protein
MIVIVLHDELEGARALFEDNISTRAESQGWFLDAMKVKYVRFTAPVPKVMGGRRSVKEGGKERVDFTPEDDRNLVRWLATRPNRSGVGLSGIVIYRKLMEQVRHH